MRLFRWQGKWDGRFLTREIGIHFAKDYRIAIGRALMAKKPKGVMIEVEARATDRDFLSIPDPGLFAPEHIIESIDMMGPGPVPMNVLKLIHSRARWSNEAFIDAILALGYKGFVYHNTEEFSDALKTFRDPRIDDTSYAVLDEAILEVVGVVPLRNLLA